MMLSCLSGDLWSRAVSVSAVVSAGDPAASLSSVTAVVADDDERGVAQSLRGASELLFGTN